MKSGKGNANNRSGTVGGSKGKGKRRKVVSSQTNTSNSSNNKSNRQSRNTEMRNGRNENDSNSSGRQWINGEDTRQNKNYKRNANEKSRRGFNNQGGDDDRPMNMKSMPSTTHTSFSNTSRKRKGFEEDKERWRNRNNSSQKYKSSGDWSDNDNDTYWLGEDPDEEKYTLEGIRSPYYSLPFENKQIYQFGLDLNDNKRKLSESFKSPFYKYYDEYKWESLSTLDLSKVFKEHDETLLYIFYTMTNDEVQYRSAQELGRRGWLYNDSDQTWSVTRTGPAKGKNKRNKPNSRGNGKGEENTELSRYKFDTDEWSVVEFSLSEYRQQEKQPQKRFEDFNSLHAE